MSEDKFVVKDSCGDGYALEFAYGIVDLNAEGQRLPRYTGGGI